MNNNNRNNNRNYNILSGNKPMTPKPSNGHNIWPGRTSSNHESSEGENEPPNTHSTVEIDIFTDREGPGGMRVGKDFQAKIPAITPLEERKSLAQAENDRALLVWKPSDKLTDQQVENYLEMAKDKFQYSGEQALGLLYWHRFDVAKALQDLGNFTPHPEEWTIEDKVLFEQAFQFHGKAFDKIRQMLPDKSMSSLIRYYYKWKKYKTKSSVMDRQVKKFSREDGEEDLPTANANIVISNNNNNNRHLSIMQGQHYHQNANRISFSQPRHMGGNNMSDSEGDDKHNGETGKFCHNCGITCTELHSKDNISMCNTCFLYWKKTNEFRPLVGPLRRGDRQVLGALRQRRFPPKGMYINHDDLNNLASSAPQAENVTLQGLEKAVLDQKCRVQTKKQEIEILKKELTKDGGISQFKSKEGTSSANNRVNSRWTQEEIMLAAQGASEKPSSS